jgi:hypothetical protein
LKDWNGGRIGRSIALWVKERSICRRCWTCSNNPRI